MLEFVTQPVQKDDPFFSPLPRTPYVTGAFPITPLPTVLSPIQEVSEHTEPATEPKRLPAPVLAVEKTPEQPIEPQGTTISFNININLPNWRSLTPKNLTWFICLMLLFVTWLTAETAVCAKYCKPTTSSKDTWKPSDPVFPYALTTKISEALGYRDTIDWNYGYTDTWDSGWEYGDTKIGDDILI